MMIIIIIFIKDTGYVYNYILGLLVVVGVLYVRVCVSVCHSVFYSRPNFERETKRAAIIFLPQAFGSYPGIIQ